MKRSLCLLAILGACAGDPDLATYDPQHGVYELGTIWDDDTLDVCWMPNAMGTEFQHARGVVRTSAEQWEKVSRVRLVGWTACADDRPSDIRIENAELGSSWSLFGTMARKDTSAASMGINFACNKGGTGCPPGGGGDAGLWCDDKTLAAIDEDACLRIDAVHEFGHALALRHEFAHEDSKCEEKEDLDGNGRDGEELWGFDADSVMSYCNDHDRLSDGDVRSITTLYPSQVILYDDVEWGGNRIVYGPGKYTVAEKRLLADTQSIIVSPGLRARLCSATTCIDFLGSARQVALTGIESLEVVPRVSVFDGTGFRGAGASFAEGTHVLSAPWDDAISSILIPHGFVVHACANPDGSGSCGTYSGGPEWDHGLFVKLWNPALENAVSYLEVEPTVAFYVEDDFRGDGESYNVDDYFAPGTFSSARSLVVPPMLVVYACNTSNVCRTYDRSGNLPADHAGQLAFISVQHL